MGTSAAQFSRDLFYRRVGNSPQMLVKRISDFLPINDLTWGLAFIVICRDIGGLQGLTDPCHPLGRVRGPNIYIYILTQPIASLSAFWESLILSIKNKVQRSFGWVRIWHELIVESNHESWISKKISQGFSHFFLDSWGFLILKNSASLWKKSHEVHSLHKKCHIGY